jgi:hypothetical protein
MADRIVGIGQQYSTIQAGIAAAAAGDRVLVKSGTYSGGWTIPRTMSVVAEGVVVVNATTSGSGNVAMVNADNVTIQGFDFRDFGYGIDPTSVTGINGRTGIKILGNKFNRINYHVWIAGKNWLVEGNDFNSVVRRSSGGDADYARMFGSGHVVRRNFFHGTRIPQDLGPGPDYAHTDCLQFYNQNGETLLDCTIEENVFTEFVQGLFMGNETGTNTGMQRLTIRNNVFWGTSFQATGNLLGSPSWGAYIGKSGPVVGAVCTGNIFRKCANAVGYLSRSTVTTGKNIIIGCGTEYQLEGNPASNITVLPEGDLLWQNQLAGAFSSPLNKRFDPVLTRDVDNVLGPSGNPFGMDASWRVLNTAAAAYGPQMGAVVPPADVTAPVVIINGTSPMSVVQGSVFVDPGASATDNGAPIAYTTVGSVNTATVGAYALVYRATDAAGNVGQANRIVNVVAAPAIDMATQAELDAAVSALSARIAALEQNALKKSDVQSVTVMQAKP